MSAGATRFDLTTRAGAHALLEAAVATPSPSGEEAAVVRLLVDALAPYVDRTWVDAAGNARAVAGHGARALVLLGHVDTVPGWVPVRIENGVLYGRGSVDAKGSAVAAAVALARSGRAAREAWTLHWVGAVEEEVASSCGARHLLTDLGPPERIVIGEPSGADAITLGYKGRLRVRLRARRALAHSARADATAAEALVAAWSRLQAWVEQANASVGAAGAFDRLQVSLVQVASAGDGLEEWADGEVAFRLPPTWTPERLRAALAALDLGPGVEAQADAGEVAVRGARDGALARAFRVAIRTSGTRPTTKVKTGTSDWNVVAPVWDADVVAYGPGDAALDHTPNEHLPLDEFDRAVAVLAAVIGAA
ncbi:MAG: [LysW]-lysine hydrolase [Trueperaceae bacterium]|nr:[LysW]-lysine hydrolase [Trueperaceae bacterium]